MISAKTIIGVIIAAVVIGVLYVVFEKNLSKTQSLSESQTASSRETTQEIKTQKSSILNLPFSPPPPPPINESSDLLKEAEALEMRDYSSYFEDLKSKTKQ